MFSGNWKRTTQVVVLQTQPHWGEMEKGVCQSLQEGQGYLCYGLGSFLGCWKVRIESFVKGLGGIEVGLLCQLISQDSGGESFFYLGTWLDIHAGQCSYTHSQKGQKVV